MEWNQIIQQDCVAGLKEFAGDVDLIVTSPPYNIGKQYESRLRLEKYLEWQAEVIRAMYQALTPTGAVIYQVGNYVDKGKVYPLDCLLFSIFLEAGFIPRNRVVWTFGHGLHCKKRLSGRHETLLWFTKSEDYTFNLDEIRVPQKYPGKKHFKGPKKGQLSGNPLGKNPGDVWEITNVKSNHPEKTKHPCQFPLELTNRCIKAFSNIGEAVVDPFAGSGTTLVSAKSLKRRYVGFEIMPAYIDIAKERLK